MTTQVPLYYCMCPHTTVPVLLLLDVSSYYFICVFTTGYVLILLYLCFYNWICVLILLYLCFAGVGVDVGAYNALLKAIRNSARALTEPRSRCLKRALIGR